DLQIISMLHHQNIIHEEDISLENQSTLINNDNNLLNNYDHSKIEEYTDTISQQISWNKKEKWRASNSNLINDNLKNETSDILLDNLSSIDKVLESLTQENLDHESLISIDNQSYSSHSSFNNHKQL
ncbi:21786_t:CDS:2, partial [Cetraspora pellucida]